MLCPAPCAPHTRGSDTISAPGRAFPHSLEISCSSSFMEGKCSASFSSPGLAAQPARAAPLAPAPSSAATPGNGGRHCPSKPPARPAGEGDEALDRSSSCALTWSVPMAGGHKKMLRKWGLSCLEKRRLCGDFRAPSRI